MPYNRTSVLPLYVHASQQAACSPRRAHSAPRAAIHATCQRASAPPGAAASYRRARARPAMQRAGRRGLSHHAGFEEIDAGECSRVSSCRRGGARNDGYLAARYSPGYVVHQRDGLQHRHFISGDDISTMRHALSSGDDRKPPSAEQQGVSDM